MAISNQAPQIAPEPPTTPTRIPNRTAGEVTPHLNRSLALSPCTTICPDKMRPLWPSPRINENQPKRSAAEIEDDDPTDIDDPDIATDDEETTCPPSLEKSHKKRRTLTHTNASAVGYKPASSRRRHPLPRHNEGDIFTTPLKDRPKNDLISELFSASPAPKSSSPKRTKHISFDLGLITPSRPRSTSLSGIHTPSRLTLSDYLAQSERGTKCGENIWHETTNLLDMLDTEVLKSELYKRGRDATRKIAQTRADEIVVMKTRIDELEVHETYLKKRVDKLEANKTSLKRRVDELEAHGACLEKRVEELEAEREITKQVNENLKDQLQKMRISSQEN